MPASSSVLCSFTLGLEIRSENTLCERSNCWQWNTHRNHDLKEALQIEPGTDNQRKMEEGSDNKWRYTSDDCAESQSGINNAIDVERAWANRSILMRDTFLSPRSMLLTYVLCRPANSANFTCEMPCFFRTSRRWDPNRIITSDTVNLVSYCTRACSAFDS